MKLSEKQQQELIALISLWHSSRKVLLPGALLKEKLQHNFKQTILLSKTLKQTLLFDSNQEELLEQAEYFLKIPKEHPFQENYCIDLEKSYLSNKGQHIYCSPLSYKRIPIEFGDQNNNCNWINESIFSVVYLETDWKIINFWTKSQFEKIKMEWNLLTN